METITAVLDQSAQETKPMEVPRQARQYVPTAEDMATQRRQRQIARDASLYEFEHHWVDIERELALVALSHTD